VAVLIWRHNESEIPLLPGVTAGGGRGENIRYQCSLETKEGKGKHTKNGLGRGFPLILRKKKKPSTSQ